MLSEELDNGRTAGEPHLRDTLSSHTVLTDSRVSSLLSHYERSSSNLSVAGRHR